MKKWNVILELVLLRTGVATHWLPGFGSTVSSDLLEGDPESEGPGGHSDPAGNEAFVEPEEAFVADGDHQAVHRVFVQQTWNMIRVRRFLAWKEWLERWNLQILFPPWNRYQFNRFHPSHRYCLPSDFHSNCLTYCSKDFTSLMNDMGK